MAEPSNEWIKQLGLEIEESSKRIRELAEQEGKQHLSNVARAHARVSADVRRQRSPNTGTWGALRKVKHKRSRADALADKYRVPRTSKKRFVRLWSAWVEAHGINVSDRGLETAWMIYRSERALYDREGQHFRTTNGQRARALDIRGRARCTRTIQRHHRRLERMGFIRVVHVMKSKALKGDRDCLQVTLLHGKSFVTPPTGALAGGTSSLALASACSPTLAPATAGDAGRDPPDQLAPPDGGRDQQTAALRETGSRIDAPAVLPQPQTPHGVSEEPNLQVTPGQSAISTAKQAAEDRQRQIREAIDGPTFPDDSVLDELEARLHRRLQSQNGDSDS